MENIEGKQRILALISGDKVIDQLAKGFEDQEDFSSEILITTDGVDLPSLISTHTPHLVLVEHLPNDERGLDLIDELSIQYPEIPVLAILSDEDPSDAQRVLLAGARAFILTPFTKINLLTMLRRVLELQTRNVEAQSAKASPSIVSTQTLGTFSVFSPRGGAGCSSIAVNLAIALLETSGKDVLLVDGKQYFGHTDVLLNLRSKNSIVDLIPHANNLDEGLIRDVVIKHASGLNVLLAPPSIQVAQGIRPEDIYNIIVAMQAVYDYVIVDTGNSLSENAVTLLDSAFRILLVLTPDLASLRDARQFLDISHSLGYPNEKIALVMNQDGIKGGVKPSDIESALQRKLFAAIPEDAANARRSLNRGVPLQIQNPKNPISQEMKKMAESLIELVEKEMASPHLGISVDAAKQEALKKSSLFG